MSVTAVVIALLSGGFVGVVYKSAHERAAWFRAQMIDAGERFVEAVDAAEEALDELLRALSDLATSQADRQAAITRLAELSAPSEGEEEPDVVIDIREFARGVREIHALLKQGSPDVRPQIAAVLERMRQVVEGLYATGAPEIAVEHTEAVFDGIADWVNAAGAAKRTVRPARQAIDRARRARARLSLLFSGRSRGGEVFEAADDALAHLERLAGIAEDSLDGDTDLTGEGELGEAYEGLEKAVNRFGEAVSSSVRRTFRI